MQRIDISGRKYGRLTATEYISDGKWKCVCDCGGTAIVEAKNLSSGVTKSCGCIRREKSSERQRSFAGKTTSKLRDLTGQRFGHLTVLIRVPPRKWLCRCDCGKEIGVFTDNLTRNHTTSCGCQKGAMISKSLTTHGKTESRIMHIWEGMKARCLNPNDDRFLDYGGRGITICDRWLESFENFYADMGDPPDKCSIDRIDVNGNYEPSNCRWATQSQQCNNKRDTVRYFYEGEEHTLSEWATIKNVSHDRLRQRVHKLGWTFEKAITVQENLR